MLITMPSLPCLRATIMPLCNSQLFHSRPFLTADLCLRSRRPVLKSLCGILCYSEFFRGHHGARYKSFLSHLYPSLPLPSSDVLFQNWFFDYAISVFSCSPSHYSFARINKFRGTLNNRLITLHHTHTYLRDLQPPLMFHIAA